MEIDWANTPGAYYAIAYWLGCWQVILNGPRKRTWKRLGSSSPLRITRDENLQSLNLKGLFPAGEGAGYAGGIISAALDGERIAEAVTNYIK